ncbi:MAG: sigma-70 family RNA polymerase sigma factor [Pseudomonadota bacterium]|nr:sigma-70 family RNA polymerase sigma factor [Pseudomonadota bacterium]
MSGFLAINPDPGRLHQAAAGDREAQRQVYQLAAGPVFALVRRLVRGHAAAEDVFQDCMIALFDHLDDYRGEAPFGAWVRQVAARHCLMHLRSPWQRARRVLWPDGSSDPDAGVDPHDTAAMSRALAHEAAVGDSIDLERALSRLGGVDRSVVWLHDVEGLTHEEIAALFRRTTSFSKSRLARAHALLRAALDDHRPPERQLPAEGLAAQGQVP